MDFNLFISNRNNTELEQMSCEHEHLATVSYEWAFYKFVFQFWYW